MHTVTVSHSSTRSAGLTPSATAALNSRAPSQWTRSPRLCAARAARCTRSDVDRAPTATVVRVLDAEEARHRLVDLCLAHGRDDGVRIRDAVSAVEKAELDPGDDRAPSDLVDDDVRLRVGDDLVARDASAQRRTSGCPSCRSGRTQQRAFRDGAPPPPRVGAPSGPHPRRRRRPRHVPSRRASPRRGRSACHFGDRLRPALRLTSPWIT